MKIVVATIARSTDDLMPKLVLFSVELFNALYLVTCVQHAGSNLTTAAVIAMDAVTWSLSLYSMHTYAAELVQKTKELDALQLSTLVSTTFKEMDTEGRHATKLVRLRTVDRNRLRISDADRLRIANEHTINKV